MKDKIYKFIVPIITFQPLLVFAQGFTKTDSLLYRILEITRNRLIPIVFTLALLLFFWGVVKYIRSEGQGSDDGKRIMWWGIIALFVMVTVWGLVSFLQGEILGGPGPQNMPIPSIGPASV